VSRFRHRGRQRGPCHDHRQSGRRTAIDHHAAVPLREPLCVALQGRAALKEAASDAREQIRWFTFDGPAIWCTPRRSWVGPGLQLRSQPATLQWRNSFCCREGASAPVLHGRSQPVQAAQNTAVTGRALQHAAHTSTAHAAKHPRL